MKMRDLFSQEIPLPISRWIPNSYVKQELQCLLRIVINRGGILGLEGVE